MEFKLSINTDNAVFHGHPSAELSQAFTRIAHQIKRGLMVAKIEDSDGDPIEEFTFKRE